MTILEIFAIVYPMMRRREYKIDVRIMGELQKTLAREKKTLRRLLKKHDRLARSGGVTESVRNEIMDQKNLVKRLEADVEYQTRRVKKALSHKKKPGRMHSVGLFERRMREELRRKRVHPKYGVT